MKNNQLAIIGSGPTAIYLLKHISDNSSFLKSAIDSITIFEKRSIMGMGMPYTPETTDKYNLANISSEEIPELTQSFFNWLQLKNDPLLKKWNIKKSSISKSDVYSRLALGHYFHDQFKLIISKLKKDGFTIKELADHNVTDILSNKKGETVEVLVNDTSYSFSKVVISVGHNFLDIDRKENGYYGSPWPIKKLLPAKGKYYNFKIGTLGASLSAFDVVTSLSHRHGKFIHTKNGLVFNLYPKAKGFKIILHSSQGWLPHLQYEQEEPLREIYRHTNRKEILSLVDNNGFLSIELFFDKICRPALMKAFKKDKNLKIINVLKNSTFSFKDFVTLMSSKHEYIDSFMGMKKEMVLALDSIENKKPIHWMETLDDLMYCLNFHMELLNAEDHLYFKKEIMSFLMNVIAALPLSSANILLALYDANCIEMVTGKVTILEDANQKNQTTIQIENKDKTKSTETYKMFINCGGQKNIVVESYPFQSMVKQGAVRKSKVKFEKTPDPQELKKDEFKDKIFKNNKETYLYTGGIDVDATYRVMREDGKTQSNIYDITFTHITGVRPYSYGLQACNATSSIIVDSWLTFDKNPTQDKTSIEKITKLYEENENL